MFKIEDNGREHVLLSITMIENRFVIEYQIREENNLRNRQYFSGENEQLDFSLMDKYLGVIE